MDWYELKTPEGVPYYHNRKTNLTSWDKPDCLKTGDELDRAVCEWWRGAAVAADGGRHSELSCAVLCCAVLCCAVVVIG